MLSSARQVQLLVGLLFVVGFGAAAYKHFFLGFPLLASETETVWQLEGRIVFEPGEGPVEVRLNLPDGNAARRVVSSDFASPGFDYEEIVEDGVWLGRWKAERASGTQVIYIRSQSYFADTAEEAERPLSKPMTVNLDDALKVSAEALLKDLDQTVSQENALKILRKLNRPGDSRVATLLRDNSSPAKRTQIAGQLLTMAGYSVQHVRGIFLDDKARSQSIYNFLEVSLGDKKILLDARENASIPWDRVILLQRGDEPLLEVFGGNNSRTTFATTKVQRAAFTSAVEAAGHAKNPLIDFSIYSLPLSEQNTFKLLLVMPLGALVVVILRNLVGIRTSGTFMPVLIALTFLQTSLITGLMLFIIVVGVGLVMRSYLSSLNLLLVPRIASVLVFVIIIYGAIGVMSTKMGWQGGLKVTFFPMIILSWTIERMSILWDESGPHEVMIEGFGSLLTASLAYLLMSNSFVADTVFLYPELLLVLLGVIIAIGTYSGYRLSDLRRFEPMERH
ncbi:UUP1 family membrane protein [Aestuariicella hydrocarbonica]|uniref:UUP1 family membrane protein n=1 Tax=Pseudomaricurvus hydrocarbonicus TaxID=1470433 RepID=A0A9E5MHU5_9GAMM|nr:UUP1 family membrane protein [Aestuariicella hydrocarbonica]NHO66411.1 UUP1 family membrane protein [Aestuariicella hydrocarbonica]